MVREKAIRDRGARSRLAGDRTRERGERGRSDWIDVYVKTRTMIVYLGYTNCAAVRAAAKWRATFRFSSVARDSLVHFGASVDLAEDLHDFTI